MRARTRDPTAQLWQVTTFADDVKIQAGDVNMMQHLPTAATERAEENVMTRNAKKCTIVTQDGNTQEPPLVIGGKQINNSDNAE